MELVKELPAQCFLMIFLVRHDPKSVAGSQKNDWHDKKILKNRVSAGIALFWTKLRFLIWNQRTVLSA